MHNQRSFNFVFVLAAFGALAWFAVSGEVATQEPLPTVEKPAAPSKEVERVKPLVEPSAAPGEKNEELTDFIAESSRLSPATDGVKAESDYREKARRLSSHDLQTLRAWVADAKRTPGERRSSLYLLSLAGPRALPHLTQVAESAVVAAARDAVGITRT